MQIRRFAARGLYTTRNATAMPEPEVSKYAPDGAFRDRSTHSNTPFRLRKKDQTVLFLIPISHLVPLLEFNLT